ncbi:hypothetical protein FN846DRAFT_110225 [Sphaerosporella brunnea]|uniref:Uncharacterized protein n=1 Tax=Sphaerosporella brunnea TaxID=1250544 RepID=A0A5J5ESF4_9PEZI|nr:hypothetical protein FN846DRAFT_110225 [Sphaerosporella brunnea]
MKRGFHFVFFFVCELFLLVDGGFFFFFAVRKSFWIWRFAFPWMSKKGKGLRRCRSLLQIEIYPRILAPQDLVGSSHLRRGRGQIIGSRNGMDQLEALLDPRGSSHNPTSYTNRRPWFNQPQPNHGLTASTASSRDAENTKHHTNVFNSELNNKISARKGPWV